MKWYEKSTTEQQSANLIAGSALIFNCVTHISPAGSGQESSPKSGPKLTRARCTTPAGSRTMYITTILQKNNGTEEGQERLISGIFLLQSGKKILLTEN